jgi:hypothetical protein
VRIKEFRQRITDAILAERDRCARIADKHGSRIVADEIRAARPPQIRVVRPETVAKDPSILTPETLVAGEALIGDEIVRRRIGA